MNHIIEQQKERAIKAFDVEIQVKYVNQTKLENIVEETHQATIAEVVRIAESLPNYNKSFGSIEGGLISKNAFIEAITSNKE